MERVSFDIEREDVAEALQETARANGRSIEAELAALVEQTYRPPAREKLSQPTGYPPGYEPLPGESFVDHISRVSRPGFDLEEERDRTPHHGIEL